MDEPNLFNQNGGDASGGQGPLAHRMRPRSLKEFIGQQHILAPGGALRNAIECDRVPSMIFYGPPGTGKTSLARVIAGGTSANFRQVSAVNSGVADLRKVFTEAADELALHGRRTILFVDEIHRFSKAQQDALLPVVESGQVTLIGATTENPYFEVTGPLLSRCELFEFLPLLQEEMEAIIVKALEDVERGLGARKLQLGPDSRQAIARASAGDARAALAILEAATQLTGTEHTGDIPEAILEEAIHRKPVFYQKDGDLHYDAISAFIKSMRGSDADAAVYWLAVMLTGGEDPKYIARRMVIFASEDIGNADPRALLIATATADAVEYVGLPECRINLAQGAAYLALAPKSNASCKAIGGATRDVKEMGTRRPPQHLRDSHYQDTEKPGHGQEYKYPHDYPDARVNQDYLPSELKGHRYYEPADRGFERHLLRVMKELAAGKGGPVDGGGGR